MPEILAISDGRLSVVTPVIPEKRICMSPEPSVVPVSIPETYCLIFLKFSIAKMKASNTYTKFFMIFDIFLENLNVSKIFSL